MNALPASSSIRPGGHRPPDRPAGAAFRPSILVRALVGLAVLVGCEEIVVNTVPVSTVAVVPGEAELTLGESASFTVELYGEGNDVLSGREVTWGSEDPSVVRIDDAGVAVAMGAGVTEITATVEGKTGTASVVVISLPRIDLNRSSVAFSVVAGGRAPQPIEVEITNGGAGTLSQLSATVTYEDGPAGWLDGRLTSTEAPATMRLTVESAVLDAGTYAATVLVADSEAINSPAELEVTLQVQQDVPAAPSNLDATDVSAGAVVLNWTDNSGNESGFQVHRRAPGEEALSLLATVGPDVTDYRDEAVTADGRYDYQVRACNSAGCSSFSGQASVATPPIAPSSVTAEATSPTTVEIGWVDNSVTETGFQVERRVAGAEFALVGSVEADSTAFVDTGLEPETEYDYRVRACNADGCSAFSSVVSATTPTASAPAAPSGLSAALVGTDRIDLTWADNATDESEVRVERASGSGSFVVIASLPANSTAYSDEAVAADTEYSYRVSACNSNGCSPPSGVAAAVTPPVPPTDFGATAVSDSRIDVTWTDASDTESSFRVERRTGTDAFALVQTTAADVTTHTSSGLEPATTYEFRVQACNAGGCSPYSEVVSATTSEAPPPADPSALTATLNVDGSEVQLEWTDNSDDETSFRIHRSVDGGTFTQRTTVAANTTSFNDGEIADDHVYTYRVEACNDAGCSGFTNEASVQTPPTAPSGLGAGAVSESQISLAWTDNSATETGFRVERRITGGTFAEIAVVAADATGYQDSGLTPSTTYEYRVRACNAADDCSAYSNTADATTEQELPSPPSTPSDFVAKAESATMIELDWDDVSTEDSYQIERSSDGTNFSPLATVAANITEYTDEGLEPGTTYHYRLRACNDGGCSGWAGPVAATTKGNSN